MIYLEKYENYFEFDKIISESVLVFSDEFLNKLEKFKEFYPEISQLLLSLNNKDFPSINICNVNVDLEDPEFLKFTTEKNQKTQSVKTGRMLKRLLDLIDEKSNNISSEDMEKAINMFKAIIAYNKDKFKEVSGPDIYTYYNMIPYEKVTGKGQMGKSCMNQKPEGFFELYINNPEKVKLVVLEEKGEMVGRAILWKTDNGFEFLDRIYTYEDKDIDTFKLYADDNGYWYKEKQNTSYMNRDKFNYKFNIVSRGEMKSVDIVVSLNKFEVESYPYLDSLCYFNSEEGKLSNHRFAVDADLLICNMDGGYKASDFEWVF